MAFRTPSGETARDIDTLFNSVYGDGGLAPAGGTSGKVFDVGGARFNLKAPAYGAKGDGVTDDSAAFPLWITAMGATGVGEVPPGVYINKSQLVPPVAGGQTWFGYGATIKWNGPAGAGLSILGNTGTSGTAFNQFNLKGFTFDGNNIQVHGLYLQCWQNGSIQDVTVQNCQTAATTAGVRLEATVGTTATNNTDFNVINNLTITGCNVGLQLLGAGSGVYVTDNQFYGLHITNCFNTVLRLVSWCDSNYFEGFNYQLQSTGSGIIFNDSATPAVDVGVYNETFWGVTADAFNGPGLGVGSTYPLVFNVSKQIMVNGIFTSPVGPGTGWTALINDVSGRALSYEVKYLGNGLAGTGNRIVTFSKNSDILVGSIAPSATYDPTNKGSIRILDSLGVGNVGGLEWLSSVFSAGAGFRLVSADLGGGLDVWELQARNNNAAWTAIFRFDTFGHQYSLMTSVPPVGTNLGANVTSVTPAGNDQTGTLAVVMAGALAANTRIATITFGNTYGANTPRIRLTNETSGAGLAVVNFYVQAQATGVSFDIACNQALAAGTYTIGYSVLGR